jgi:hypothetical protein
MLDIDGVDAIRILNIVIALLSVPPSIMLFKTALSDRPQLINGRKELNTILILLFMSFIVSAFANAILTSLIFLKISFERQIIGDLLFNARNLIVNFGYCTNAWGFWYIIHRYRNE